MLTAQLPVCGHTFRSLASQYYYSFATPFALSTRFYKSLCICIIVTIFAFFHLKFPDSFCLLQSFVVVSAFVLLCRPTRTFFLSHYVVVGATGQSGESHAALFEDCPRGGPLSTLNNGLARCPPEGLPSGVQLVASGRQKTPYGHVSVCAFGNT